MKRIEYRGRYLRASRTGGVALRAQIRAGDIKVTANSTHGVRVSRRLFKGTQIALQNGRPVLRGRYQAGPLNINLSRSGLSASSKVGPGTVNWTRPLRSSATVAGINVRGRNALAVHAIYALISLLVLLVTATISLLTVLGIGLYRFALWTGSGLYGLSLWLVERYMYFRGSQARQKAEEYLAEQGISELLPPTGLAPALQQDLLQQILTDLATGVYLESPTDSQQARVVGRINAGVEAAGEAHFPGVVIGLYEALLDEYLASADDSERSQAFTDALQAVPVPNRLQEQLLMRFAKQGNIRLVPVAVE